MRIRDIIRVKNTFKTAYKNYISILWNIWRRKDKIKVVLENCNSIYVSKDLVWSYADLIANKNVHISDLLLYTDSIKFTYNNTRVTVGDSKGDLGAVFGREEYSFLVVENETVIDMRSPNAMYVNMMEVE